jgi:hypothetical protein
MKDPNEHVHDHSHEGEHGHDHDEAFELELSTQSQIFLEMREQNLELLKVAAQVAGYSGSQGAMKPGDARRALHDIWEVFSEFYSWIDPEEAEDDDDDEDEGEDDDE